MELRHLRYFGRAADGRFEVRTLRPAPCQIPTDGDIMAIKLTPLATHSSKLTDG